MGNFSIEEQVMNIDRTIPAEKMAAQIRGYAMQFGGAGEASSPNSGYSINAANLNIPGAGKGIEQPKDEYIPSFPQLSFQEEPAPKDEEPPAAEETGETEAEVEEQAQNQEEDEEKNGELSPEDQRIVVDMQARDREVRAHEQAHVSVGGRYVTGGPTYEYEKGPDKKQYAVGGEVGIDSSPVKNDPEATIAKMQVVRAAALAPPDPSGQDRAVASAASRAEGQARAELREQRAAEARGDADGGAQNTAQNETSQQSQSRVVTDAISAYTKPFDPQTSQTVVNFAA